MSWWLARIRRIVFLSSIALGCALFFFVMRTIPPSSLRWIRLSEVFGLTALIYLYLALLATPLTRALPGFRYAPLYLTARRAIGVSAFFFALLHTSISFWKLLGGFPGFAFLNTEYRVAILVGFTALVILAMMAATSFDAAVQFLGRRWKMLHRLVYGAGVLVLIHALMLGSHFGDLSRGIPQLSFLLLAILFFLEARRADMYLAKRFPSNLLVRRKPTALLVVVLCVLFVVAELLPSSSRFSLGIHARHTSAPLP